ncbi:tyrosine-type recombinase/integrase [Bacillus paranthracis]|uniref:tyrosine-type recombinase/integrase n=1 Tax=Bacillus paranthracis TaxID=2026186 RepID=UPI001E45EDA1|nr:tyrosine-type recombinase/integrase [Bacillus paranthracis]MCC2358310.1 tyrosine-type recombinase/integrase [Bacillus paranthracis]
MVSIKQQKAMLVEYKSYLLSKGYTENTVSRYIKEILLYYNSMEKPISEEYIQIYLHNRKSHTKISNLKRIQSVLINYYYFLFGVKLGPILNENKLKNEKITYLKHSEFNSLVQTVLNPYPVAIGEKEKLLRSILKERNLMILLLLGKYGLTRNEVVTLNMDQVNFYIRNIKIGETNISIQNEDMNRLYDYYKSIPVSIRPMMHSEQAVFIAYDNNRMTYLWDYSKEMPKRLSDEAIKKLIRKEGQYAGLHNISSRVLRNTAIINALNNGESVETVKTLFRLKSIHAVNRYRRFLRIE